MKYDDSGTQLSANFADALENGGKGPLRTFTPYENFWHGVGHLRAGSTSNGGKAMEVENAGGAIRKTIEYNADGSVKTATANPIPGKPYNLDHPKKRN